MKFSLRTLILTVTMLPPVIWYVWDVIMRLTWHNHEKTVEFPDPVLAVGVIGWISLYAMLVRRPARAIE